MIKSYYLKTVYVFEGFLFFYNLILIILIYLRIIFLEYLFFLLKNTVKAVAGRRIGDRIMLKRIISSVLCAAAILPSAACGKKDESGQVYFLNFKPEIADIYKKVAADYKKETGKSVKVVTAASGTYEQTLKSEIAKTNPPTIFQVNGPIGYSSWKDYCTDLSGTELYKTLSDKDMAIKSEGGVYAIPYAVEGYGIIYNDAIMRKYFSLPDKKSSLSSAEQINSFEKLSEVVSDMQEKKDLLGIDGVFASTSLGSGEQWRWHTHLANIPFYHEFEEDNPSQSTITTGVEAQTVKFEYSDNYKRIFDLYTDNSVIDKKLLGGKSTSDAMAEFALGKCAMVQNGDWAWAQIKEVGGNTVSEDDIKFMPIYMGFKGEENQGLCIGTENYIAVNDKADEASKAESVAFLEWLFTSDTGKKYVSDELGFNAPFSSFTENERPSDPLGRQVIEWSSSGKENIEWTFLSFPSEEFKNYFGDALLQYVQGNSDWENVKETVIEKWKSERSK